MATDGEVQQFWIFNWSSIAICLNSLCDKTPKIRLKQVVLLTASNAFEIADKQKNGFRSETSCLHSDHHGDRSVEGRQDRVLDFVESANE